MPFSQASISDVRVDMDGPELFISWASTALQGTCHQVYVDKKLAWWGRSHRCHIPQPAGSYGRNIWIDVATIDAYATTLDYSAQLTGIAGLTNRASLTWKGGTYLDPTGNDDVSGFLIYGSDSPGVPIDYSMALATIAAYPGGWISDGFGMDGFGGGGFGRAATVYEWESATLTSGVWQFAIVSFDQAGNSSGAGLTASLTIVTPPLPPAASATGSQLNFQYSGPNTRLLTLNWLASPSTG